MQVLLIGQAILFEGGSFSGSLSYIEDNESALETLKTISFDAVITGQFEGLERLLAIAPPTIYLADSVERASDAFDLGVYDVVVCLPDGGHLQLVPAILRKLERELDGKPRPNDNNYRLLVRNLPDMGVILFDHDLRLLIVEGHVLEERGYISSSMEGKQLHEVIQPGSYEMLLPQYLATLKGETAHLFFSQGGYDYDVRFIPLTNGRGETTMGMVIINDITEIRQFENVLQQTHENFVSLIHNVDIGIMLLDEETEILLNNDIAFELLGLTNIRTHGVRFVDLEWDMIREDGTRISREEMPLTIALRDRKKIHNEVIGIFNELKGKYIWLMFSVVPQMNSDDSLRHMVCSFSDITPLKEAREAHYASARQYRLLADNITDIVALRDENGNFIYISPSVTRMLGWLPEEVTGTDGEQFIHPEDRNGALRQANPPWLTDAVQEWRCMTRDGGYLWLETHTHRVPDSETQSPMFISSSRDITQRREAELRLRLQSESRKLLNDVLRVFIDKEYKTAIDDALALVGRFLSADRVQMLEIRDHHFSLRNEWCYNGVQSELGSWVDMPVSALPCRTETLMNGKPVAITVDKAWMALRKKYGMPTVQPPNNILNAPVIDHGTVVGVVAVSSLADRTWTDEETNLMHFFAEIIVMGRRRHQFEKELVNARDIAETANRAKSTFLANMSHELRTPLNAILGFAQLFERDHQLSPVHRESVSIISRSGEHLLDLINDVLEMSKIEVGHATLNRRAFDLLKLIESLTGMLRLRAEAKGLSFETSWGENVPRYINGDERKLRQVFINLIGNAVKYTRDGGVVFRVYVTESGESENPDEVLLRFEVEDTGYGIAKEEFPFLFEAFRQTESGKSMHDGSGLGLSISREYVLLMGGDIDVQSTLGKGSTFGFTIPVHPANPEDSIGDEDVRRVIGIEAGQASFRVMVVEDRAENRLLIQRLLSKVGFEVFEATDGQEAVDKFEAIKPDLIFMDLRMPRMDGYEATRQIRQLEGGEAVVIVALTASVFDSEEVNLLSNGFDAMIRKPFRQRMIFDSLSRFLGVRYIYEYIEEEVKTSSTTFSNFKPQQISEVMFLALPTDIIGQLHKSARKADHAEVLRLIPDIQHYNKDIATYVTDLMNQFDFEKLVKLTQR